CPSAQSESARGVSSVGRTPEPAPLRLLKGDGKGRDSGGRRIPDVPAFARTMPTPPDDMSDAARAVWDRITPELHRLGLLKDGAREVLVAACEQWAVFRAATATIRAEGLFIDAKQGTLAHPAVGIQRAAAKELRSIAAHFGLTPSTEQALAR